MLTAPVLQRAVNIHRFGNGLAQRTAALLARARDDIASHLVNLDPTAASFRTRRLAALYRQTQDTLNGAYRDIENIATADLRGLARDSIQFTTAGLEQALKSVGASGVTVQSVAIGETLLASIVDTNPVHGAQLGAWFAKQSADAGFAFRREIQLGMAQSETLGELVGRVRGVLDGPARGTAAIVRTAVNEVANAAQYEVLAANDDITDEYQYVATLDANTTEICAALDGQTFRYDDDAAPKPPQHIGCRSMIVAVVNWTKLGVPAPAPGTRATGNGVVVDERVDYQSWLRDQSAQVQNDVLGVGKAELFRGGSITLRDLIRSDGSVATLADLQAQTTGLAGSAIEKAFADVHLTERIVLPEVTAEALAAAADFRQAISEGLRLELPNGSAGLQGPAASSLRGREAYDSASATTRALNIEVATRQGLGEGASYTPYESVTAYQGGGYDRINTTLRNLAKSGEPVAGLGGNEVANHTADDIRNLDAAFLKTQPLEQPVVVYRGMGTGDPMFEAVKYLQKGALSAEDMLGTELSKPGYTSTSTSLHTATDFASPADNVFTRGVYEIEIPAGTRVLVPGAVTDAHYEFEIVLERGRRYRVVGVRQVLEHMPGFHKGSWIIRLELVP